MCSLRALIVPMFFSIATLSLATACKSEPNAQGKATGKTIQQAADELDKSIVALDATIVALNALVNEDAPPADPTAQFKLYSKELATLESHATSVRDLAASMDKNSKAYMTQWDAEIATIANEDIKERSQERRQKVEKLLTKISEEYGEAREEFKPLLADLQDIRGALATDLTPDGIDSMRDVAEDAADDSKDVKETLTELSKKYRELGVGLGQAVKAAPATKTP